MNRHMTSHTCVAVCVCVCVCVCLSVCKRERERERARVRVRVAMRVSVCVSGCMSSDCRHAHAIAPVSHALDVADVRIEHQNASLTRGNTVPHIIAKLDDVCTTTKHVLVTVIYS